MYLGMMLREHARVKIVNVAGFGAGNDRDRLAGIIGRLRHTRRSSTKPTTASLKPDADQSRNHSYYLLRCCEFDIACYFLASSFFTRATTAGRLAEHGLGELLQFFTGDILDFQFALLGFVQQAWCPPSLWRRRRASS